MTVGRRLREQLGADHRGGSGPVVHDHLLAQRIGQLLPDQARYDPSLFRGHEAPARDPKGTFDARGAE